MYFPPIFITNYIASPILLSNWYSCMLCKYIPIINILIYIKRIYNASIEIIWIYDDRIYNTNIIYIDVYGIAHAIVLIWHTIGIFSV